MILIVSEVRMNFNCRHFQLALGLSLILLATLLMIGCNVDQDYNARPGGSQSSPSPSAKVVNKEGNYITAAPNPVSSGGLTGKTTISWGTKGIPGLDVHVFVYDLSGNEVGMFATGSVGSQEAPWISAPTEFRLYQGMGSDKKLLDSVTVTREP